MTRTAPTDDTTASTDARYLVALRRELHRHPEVGLRLPWTQRRILDELDGLGLEITTGVEVTSVVAVLRGGAAGSVAEDGGRPTVLLRADMDGLPVAEDTGLDWASTNGAMHACGHDLHMAVLLAAARELAARRAELPGDVVFMFQPGEENWGGARVMLREGVLDAAGRRPDAVFGLHVFSYGIPGGTFGFRHGPILSASNIYGVTFRGRGGHGSAPHLANGPVPALTEFVPALHTAISQGLSMLEPVVLTVGQIHAGAQDNVIPESGEVRGTARTFSEAANTALEEITRRVAAGVAAANGVEAEVAWRVQAPPTSSDPAEADFARAVAAGLVGEERAVELPDPYSVSEDFAWVLEEVPGLFVLLGAAPDGVDPATAPANHSPRARFDDAVLVPGARLEVEWAVARLRALAS